MKVLLLRKQGFGDIATHSTSLASALRERGVEVEIEEASESIPDQTGGKIDKQVSEWLRKRADSFDLVHAFEYRSAWACAEAFGYEEAWLYTAYGMPKTTHRMLVDRLNRSQAGICSSNAVLRVLDGALALDLAVIHPGVPTIREANPERKHARRELGLEEPATYVASMGRFTPEYGFGNLIASFADVLKHVPDAELLLAGEGPEEGNLRQQAAGQAQPERIRFFGIVENNSDFFCSADLFVVPADRAGFSLAAVESMSVGTPVLLRNSGGLPEIVDPEISGFLFHSDEELGSRISELLNMPISLESVGNAGRLRVLERFTLEQCADSVVELYRSICQDVM